MILFKAWQNKFQQETQHQYKPLLTRVSLKCNQLFFSEKGTSTIRLQVDFPFEKCLIYHHARNFLIKKMGNTSLVQPFPAVYLCTRS